MKKVICVVEDEKAINDLVAQYLKKEGYEVRSYYTYEEAVAHVQDDDVHLWILDIMLDDKSGFDLIEEIRLQGRDIPVIFMSARDKEFDRIIGLEKGSDDYITKPFNPVEVLARVKSQLRRFMQLGAAVKAPSELTVGGIALDHDAKRVTLDGEEIALTPKEYDILYYLMQHPGKVFTPAELYSAVWNEAPVGIDNTVAVHIRHLREKLEINPSEPRYLKVVWGKGYKLEGDRA